jgi:ComF family protein
MTFFQTVLGALFPDACVGCATKGTLLCSQCLSKIPPAPACEHAFILSLYAYRDPRVRALVRMLKYKNTRHASAIFAPELAAIFTEWIGEEGRFLGSFPVLLVPVPLSRKRMRERGYNQAELLARGMLGHLFPGTAMLDTKILRKVIETGKQADIKKRSERLANLGDCFSAVPAKGGEVIVLVDDVTTTGATLIAARKALRAAGYKKIFALTVAH